MKQEKDRLPKNTFSHSVGEYNQKEGEHFAHSPASFGSFRVDHGWVDELLEGPQVRDVSKQFVQDQV